MTAAALMSEVGPLTGFTIGITAARRRKEFGAALERRGAAVLYAPAIQIVPTADDEALREITAACIAEPPDILVATTGIGFRGWVEAADGWGLGAELLAGLTSATLLARGPKARGAMRAAGLSGEWSPASESSTEVLERLLTMELSGRRVVIQEHGEPLPDVVDVLRASGAIVLEVPVYRWIRPADPAPLIRMCHQVVGRELNAVTFTSAPAAASFLMTAQEEGLAADLAAALQHDVLAVAVGPVTAGPLDRSGIPVLQPERARLGALVREVVRQVPPRFTRRVVAAGHRLELRSRGVLVDDRYQPLAPTAMALLDLLAAHPGQVVGRAVLAGALSGPNSDEHATETAIGRLRTALGDPKIIQTLVKRGYRLAFDPEAGSSWRY